jgi:hypothetical protein
MINNDYGCAEIAPKCVQCGHSLVWRKGRLFHQPESACSTAATGGRPHFIDFRGGWLCPECDERPLTGQAADETSAAGATF